MHGFLERFLGEVILHRSFPVKLIYACEKKTENKIGNILPKRLRMTGECANRYIKYGASIPLRWNKQGQNTSNAASVG